MSGRNKFNGAYYYSVEIVKNIIPNVETDRDWVTVNVPPYGRDHAIVFIHNNKNTERYEWLAKYHDLILVCGVQETCSKVAHLGKAVYLPLSIDVGHVEQFRVPESEREGTAYVGRRAKRKWTCSHVPNDADLIEDMGRDALLERMAHYQNVYAVGRTACEAKCLGCNVIPYDSRYPDPSVWQVIDNKTAAVMLQKMLNEIDGKENSDGRKDDSSSNIIQL